MTRVILIGNKADLEERRVSRDDIEQLASEHNIPFFEVSAKTGLGVEEAFLASVDGFFSFHKFCLTSGTDDIAAAATPRGELVKFAGKLS